MSATRLLRAGAMNSVRASGYRVCGETGDAVLVALPSILRELREARASIIELQWCGFDECFVKVTEWEDR